MSDDETKTDPEATEATTDAAADEFLEEVDTEDSAVPGVDIPGYWDDIKITATLAAMLWPHVPGGVDESVQAAREILAASARAIDAEFDAKEARQDATKRVIPDGEAS